MWENMDIPKRLESSCGLILSYISWKILYAFMQQSKETPKVRKTTFGVFSYTIRKFFRYFYLNLWKITRNSPSQIEPGQEKRIHIEVHRIWPVLYWSNCGQNFLRNQKLCRMMKKWPFLRVLSLKNGLFLVEVRRLELRASWSQTRRSTRWATPRRWKNLWNCSSHRTGQNCGQTTFARVGQTANARFSSVFLAFPRFFETRIG